MALLVALVAAYGVFLLFTARVCSWQGLGIGPRLDRGRPPLGDRLCERMVQAGLGGVRIGELGAVMASLFVVGAASAFALFGGWIAPLMLGALTGSLPIAAYRARRDRRRSEAREAWPRMIEEIRLLTGSLGRSVPQALLDVGGRGPDELSPAFAAARREWLLSTDFSRTVEVLKRGLADPTADAACETLLVAHEVGGSDIDRRLGALVEDRTLDLQCRKDARSRQAGVRFARRFVLLVPLGMATAGLSIGPGRQAYQTVAGQLGVAFGLAVVAVCWVWAGTLLRLPEEARVFHE